MSRLKIYNDEVKISSTYAPKYILDFSRVKYFYYYLAIHNFQIFLITQLVFVNNMILILTYLVLIFI